MKELPFKELPEHRQLEIISNSVHSMGDHWYEYMIGEIGTELSNHGFNETEVSFTGFYSQGDGASFTSDWIDVREFINREQENMDFTFAETDGSYGNNIDPDLEVLIADGLLEPDERLIETLVNTGFFYASVNRINTRYVHYNSVRLNLEPELYDIIEYEDDRDIMEYHFTEIDVIQIKEFLSYLDTYMSEWVKDKCKEIYNRLEKEWEDFHKSELEHYTVENELFPA